MEYNVKLVAQWFVDMGITTNSSPEKQLIKSTEELGEIAVEILAKDRTRAAGEIGDYLVTLIGVSQQLGVKPQSVVASIHIDTYPDNLLDLREVTPLKNLGRLVACHGALCEAVCKNREIDIALTDCSDAVNYLCHSLSLDVNECLRLAYKKISARTGKMVNGILVKEADL